MQLGNHPTPPKFAPQECRKSTSESGGIQAAGACGQTSQIANLLVGAWRRRGCRLKRLLRRWGPGGKRSRDTPPTPPPFVWGKEEGVHPPPSATIQHAPQGRRTLNGTLNPKTMNLKTLNPKTPKTKNPQTPKPLPGP